MSSFTFAQIGGLGERSKRIARGFALAIFTVVMLGSMHGFGGLPWWVWLSAALPVVITTTGTAGYGRLFARLVSSRTLAKLGMGVGLLLAGLAVAGVVSPSVVVLAVLFGVLILMRTGGLGASGGHGATHSDQP